MTKFADHDENSINFLCDAHHSFNVFVFYLVIVFFFFRPYTFEMVLLTHGRISFGGFLCLPDPFWVLTLLVTEFVVFPTHDYATFSLYDSDVYISL